jgi:hypothetical protein
MSGIEPVRPIGDPLRIEGVPLNLGALDRDQVLSELAILLGAVGQVFASGP